MTLPFFTDARRVSLESTGVSEDAARETVAQRIKVLQSQASKMWAIRPNPDTSSSVEVLKNLDKKVTEIMSSTKGFIKEDKFVEEQASTPSSRAPGV